MTSRRQFLVRSAAAGSALAVGLPANGGADPIRHYPARAKNVIQLFMAGAPSALDLFEDKPVLRKHDGELVPQHIVDEQRFAFLKGRPKLLGSPYTFRRYGAAGFEFSELLPHLAQIADKLSFIRSVHQEQFNHGPAQVFAHTGHQLVGRPSLGSWLLYGLGSENRDLPGFTVLVSGKIDPGAGSACWGAGFLPSHLQGVELRTRGELVPCLQDPQGMDRSARRRGLDLLGELNRAQFDAVGDPSILERTESYELAYRMQESVPELARIDEEPERIHRLYGSRPGKRSFANNCLLARRLVERGVRCVQVVHRGWDHHGSNRTDDLMHGLPNMCRQTDRAAAALILDLEQRGLLDDTLVVWGGEFGRTPMREVRDLKFLGRDHNPRAFTMWFAGGGIQPGRSVGLSDDIGYDVAEHPVHLHDVHATMLHLTGIDHERLTYRYQGRDYRLTDVFGKVVGQLL